MSMDFLRKLPIPKETKEKYPLSEKAIAAKKKRDEEIKEVIEGRSNKMVLIIGPCSADAEAPVMDYIYRLRKVQDEVADKLILIPRIYTNKPRTTGDGYKGMVHQPDPEGKPDVYKGILSIRSLHTKCLTETGLSSADEMLYPANYLYLADLLSYIAIGARSVENQEHRLVSSGIDIPVGMKNPTSGDLSVMLNAIKAAQNPHSFVYRGWEVNTDGNKHAHAILRGYVNKHGESQPNYHYEDLEFLYQQYCSAGVENVSLIIDANHANSGKKPLEQIRICKEALHSARHNSDIQKMLKGFMIESYIEDGCQKIGEGVYGKSITDPCLGWEKSQKLIYEIADLI